jgi:Leucine-rich repeat (LRR) protein
MEDVCFYGWNFISRYVKLFKTPIHWKHHVVMCQVLILFECSIRIIKPMTFQYSSNLLYLDLSHNLIEKLDRHTFYGLYQLKILNIEGNQMIHTRNGKFCPKTKLLFSNVEPLILSLRLCLGRINKMFSIISSLQV